MIHSIVLNFTTGTTIPISTFNEVLHELGSPMLHQPQVKISSYWFRSVHATLADMRRAPWHERLPLGNWSGKHKVVEGETVNMIPLRYARTRAGTEQFAKILQMDIMTNFLHNVKSPVTWESARSHLETLDMGKMQQRVAA